MSRDLKKCKNKPRGYLQDHVLAQGPQMGEHLVFCVSARRPAMAPGHEREESGRGPKPCSAFTEVTKFGIHFESRAGSMC